jgi:para-nitrobenzyl esterase
MLVSNPQGGNMDAIKIDSGYISGKVLGEPDKEVKVFLGIPYGGPAGGEMRWKSPQPVEPWQGVRECVKYGDASPQEPPGMPYPQKERSENCLTLNVLTPAKKASEKLPVMVWFHGGGYFTGSANNRLYSSIPLPQHGVVLVTTNHRLGVMGLMAHPLLSGESPDRVSGNYMVLDMIASLKWVKKNIAAFGGDPNNVTIFGESGGGGKVACLMASPLAKSLFHRAICESGTAVGEPFFGGLPLEELEKRGERLFERLGVNKEKNPLKAARAVPWQKVLEIEQTFAIGAKPTGMPFTLWDAAIDGWCFPDVPTNIFKAGKHNAVPLITGANLGELSEGMVVMPWIIPAYVTQLTYNSRAGSKGYAYIFDHVPAGWKKTGMKSTHGMEVNYVFGLPKEEWTTVFPGARLPDPEWGEADEKVGETIMRLWAQFARTGNPGIKGLIDWPAYDESGDKYLYIAEPLRVKYGFSRLVTKEDIAKRML